MGRRSPVNNYQHAQIQKQCKNINQAWAGSQVRERETCPEIPSKTTHHPLIWTLEQWTCIRALFVVAAAYFTVLWVVWSKSITNQLIPKTNNYQNTLGTHVYAMQSSFCQDIFWSSMAVWYSKYVSLSKGRWLFFVAPFPNTTPIYRTYRILSRTNCINIVPLTRPLHILQFFCNFSIPAKLM